MRRISLLVLLLILGWCRVSGAATDEFAQVREADRARIAATIAGDATQLGNLLSDALRYGHSDGRVQTKEQFVAAVSSNKTKYLSVEPRDLDFQLIGENAVAMSGRARLSLSANGTPLQMDLRFLGIWRREAGQWRLLAYQSTPLASSAGSK